MSFNSILLLTIFTAAAIINISINLQAEISLCRVYKRAGVEDHPSLPRSLPSRASSSSSSRVAIPVPVMAQSDRKQHNTIHTVMEKLQAFGGVQTQQMDVEKMSETDGSNNSDVTTVLGLSKDNTNAAYRALGLPASMEEEGMLLQPQSLSSSKQARPLPLVPFFTGSSVSSNIAAIDELHRLVNYQQPADHHHHQQQYYTVHHQHQQTHQFSPLPPQVQQLGLNTLPASSLPTAFSDRLWEWNPIPEENRDFTNPFK